VALPQTPFAGEANRRELFPRGLFQPSGGFRFGADTLLLSAFAASSLPRAQGRGALALTGLDLGTGCGAASLGLLLLRPDLTLALLGLDTGPEMIDAATKNASALGLGERFRAELADVRDYCPASGPGFDLALANPPFRAACTGRACADEARNRARFEGPGGFGAFAACAARSLRQRGKLFLVHLAERLPELLRALEDEGLAPRRALPVQGGAGKAPRLVLLECSREVPRLGRAGFALLAPLVLYAADGALTPEAASFCPPLVTNPRRAAG
jgi:tRNA1Val (adenine37-N6)-methyltransferase